MGRVKTAHNPPNTVDNTTNLFGSGKPEPKKKASATVTPGDRKEEPKKSKKQTYREERKSGNLSEESKKYAESRQKQAKDKRRGTAKVKVQYLHSDTKKFLSDIGLESKSGAKSKRSVRNKKCSVNCHVKLVNQKHKIKVD